MGVVIKAKTDGFRRGGIAHRAKGTYYQDGDLTEQQLAVMRADPHLLVVEGVQGDALQANQGNTELMQEMGGTIAALEHELDQVKTGQLLAVSNLEQANAGLEAERSYRLAILDRQSALPNLVVEAAKLLAPADPAQEGVILITADSLVALITEHLKPQQATPEAQNDGLQSALSTASESPSPAPVSAVAPPTGDQPAVVNTDKVAAKRGASAARNKGAE